MKMHIIKENYKRVITNISVRQAVFDGCVELIAYNVDFDYAFLDNAGIRFKHGTIIYDPMIEFAKIYEEWNNYYGYNFDELAHDSLEDVKATLVVYNALKKKLPPYVWM